MDSRSIGIINNDYNLLANRMVKLANETRQHIDKRHTEIFEGVTDLLQSIFKDVKEVGVVFSNKVIQSHEADPSDDFPNQVQKSR